MISKGFNKENRLIFPLILSLIITLVMFKITAALAQEHFQLPYPTQGLIDYCSFLGSIRIHGMDASVGDEVGFFDPDGVLCGVYVVNIKGKYGLVHVYGDDPSTILTDEGAEDGDLLSVRVWDKSREIEYSGDNIFLSEGVAQGFEPSPIPPVWWSDRGGYLLNIDVISLFNDNDDDKGGCFLGSLSDNVGFSIRID